MIFIAIIIAGGIGFFGGLALGLASVDADKRFFHGILHEIDRALRVPGRSPEVRLRTIKEQLDYALYTDPVGAQVLQFNKEKWS